MKRILALTCAVLIALFALSGCKQVVSSGTIVGSTESTEAIGTDQGGSSMEIGNITNIDDVPAQDLSAVDEDYQLRDPVDGETIAILHTNYGDISMRFFPEVAPMAVNNFIALAKEGRYDNTIFHRVINNFVIQGGDYTNFDGTGGESIYGDTFDYEVADNVKNIEGSVAMAHSSLPASNGSQFYINQVDNADLDGKYTVFGQVFDGMDVVNDIAQVDTDYSDKPLTNVVLESVEITTYQ